MTKCCYSYKFAPLKTLGSFTTDSLKTLGICCKRSREGYWHSTFLQIPPLEFPRDWDRDLDLDWDPRVRGSYNQYNTYCTYIDPKRAETGYAIAL